MALNPFFLQGSPNEQRLVQELINEQLKMYGVEVVYIPRKFVRKETILKEISSSKFNDNYAIEAYISNYDGYTGQGDILSKFGVSLKDEISLVISRERFEDFIAPFLESENNDEIELFSRPREGDLVYFPLGQRLFEVKFVEHENPFYQLGKLYVYEIKCELFEYEDEVIDTSIDEIDTQVQEEGYITTLSLIGSGSTATAIANIGTGYIREIFLDNDGYGYVNSPTVSISTAPPGGITASAVAITSSFGGVRSVKEILLINAGAGYTVPPKITISGGGGYGAKATCSIETIQNGILNFTMSNVGSGYKNNPQITITGSVGTGETAVGIASLGTNNQVSAIRIRNPGAGYVTQPTISIAPPSSLAGFGTYIFNEIVTGSNSGIQARVKSWDYDTKILKVSFTNIGSDDNNFGFYPGELIVGTASSATYAISTVEQFDLYDKYGENKIIQTEADQIIDFSQSNPFGNF
jgi:hypothetical protein